MTRRAIAMRYLSPQIGRSGRLPVSHWAGRPEVWLEMIHPDDRERVEAAFASWIARASRGTCEYRVIAGDGRIVWLLDRGRATERDDEGRPRVFQGAIVDITELREELESLRARRGGAAAVDRRDDARRAVDRGRSIRAPAGRGSPTSDRRLDAMFGYTAEELHGRDRATSPGSCTPTTAPACSRRASDATQTGEPWDELYRVVHRDGSVRWVLSCGRRTADSAARRGTASRST